MGLALLEDRLVGEVGCDERLVALLRDRLVLVGPDLAGDDPDAKVIPWVDAPVIKL